VSLELLLIEMHKIHGDPADGEEIQDTGQPDDPDEFRGKGIPKFQSFHFFPSLLPDDSDRAFMLASKAS